MVNARDVKNVPGRPKTDPIRSGYASSPSGACSGPRSSRPVVLVAAGLTLGTLSGITTSVWRHGSVVSRAGLAAAFLWVLGMAARFAFAVWVTHSGAAAVGRFSFRNDITGAHIWQFALVLMAYAEVLSRIGVLQVRRIRALRHPADRPCGLTAAAGQTADDPAQLAA